MRLSLALAPVLLVAGLAAPALAEDAPAPGTIYMDGVGTVSATPDTAFLTSGVTTQEDTAKAALDANSKAMTDLIATLKDAGIQPNDIQTSGFSVSPNYVYSNETDENGYSLPPIVQGYIVTNNVTVRVADISKLGSIIDKSVTVGANTINGVTFEVADKTALLNEARKAAFEEAKAKAGLYAGLADLDLGRIISIGESQSYDQPMFARQSMAAQDNAVPVEAGQMTYSVTVSVTWETAQK